MTNPSSLLLEDLILASRSLALEEKQDLLKHLDKLPEPRRTRLRKILEKEFASFEKIEELTMNAVTKFTQDIYLLSVAAPAPAAA